MTLPQFVAFLIAIAALWVASTVTDSTIPPPSVNNTPRENATGCGANLGLALCAVALLVALYFVVG